MNLVFHPKIGKTIRRSTSIFVDRFVERFFEPNLLVHVFYEYHLDLGEDFDLCYGCFLHDCDIIFMAGRRCRTLFDVPHPWDKIYLNFLAHEFAHVEQKYLGKKIQERGVVVRARTILRKLGYEPCV